MSTIAILGYYNHGNFGDEQYKETLSKLIGNDEVSFFDIDTISSDKLSHFSKIIVGGGDILNPYFLDKLENVLQTRVIGLCVGCPYPNKTTYKQIDKLFSTLFIRSKENCQLLQQNLTSTICHYLPDSSILSLSNPKKSINLVRKIGVCLSRTIYHPLYYSEYSSIIKSYASFFNKLLSEHPTILYFIPFNTGKNQNENDCIIAADIIREIESIHIDSQIISLSSTDINLFSQLDFTICMRYHSVLYSIYYKIPFLPVFTTRKIKNLLTDINWNIGYQMSTNYLDIPTDLNETIMYNRFSVLSSPKLQRFYKTKLEDIYANLYKDLLNGMLLLTDALKSNQIETISCRCNLCKLHSFLERCLYQREGKHKLYHASEISKEYLTKLVLYHLIGHHSTDYNWGLSQKMFSESFDYHSEWNYIIHDSYNWKRIIPSNPIGLYNLTYIDQNDYHSVHRSGWQFVFDRLVDYHNENAPLLLDTYVDRTFHWDKEYIKSIGVIPYTKHWIGFIHHTFDTSFSPYNCEELFIDEDFLLSLIYCRGLFVLSKYLKYQIINKLAILNLDVPVYCLTHPTDNQVPHFSYKKFKMNKNKSVIHIGAWLRNIYSFYKLKINLPKVVLKGKLMNNYFPKETFVDDLKKILSESVTEMSDASVSRPPNISGLSRPPQITNNFYKHFIEDITKELNSVQILSNTSRPTGASGEGTSRPTGASGEGTSRPTGASGEGISNEEYDSLLTDNIVYINLVDASAINTILECLVRQTPIIVNKHPAVVEILGDDYPLYLSELSIEVSFKDIKCAHKYLKKRYVNTDINAFMTQFINAVKFLQ